MTYMPRWLALAPLSNEDTWIGMDYPAETISLEPIPWLDQEGSSLRST
jgi:hypothetical protein